MSPSLRMPRPSTSTPKADDLKTVLVRYLLYPLGVTRLAVAVYRHDCRGPGGDGRLDAVGVDAAVRRVDVHEDGLDAVPPD